MIESIIEQAKKQLNADIVVLPIDNLTERKNILEDLLSETRVAEFAYFISSEFTKFKSQIEEQELPIPSFIKLEFEEEWNDGDATYPTISGLYLLDKEGERVETDEAYVKFEAEQYGGGTCTNEQELGEYLCEIINDCYSIRELEEHIGYSKVPITIREVEVK